MCCRSELEAAALPPGPLCGRRFDERFGASPPSSAPARRSAEAGGHRAHRTLPAAGASRPAGSTGTRCRSRAPARRPSRRCRSRCPCIGRRLPNRMTHEADRRDDRDQPGVLEEPATIRVTASACGEHLSPSSQVAELVERDELAVAVDEQHHRQADADLGGGDAMMNSANTWPSTLPCRREGDQVDVDRVEDELDRHEHQHGVACGRARRRRRCRTGPRRAGGTG
jgi:hypothetical protein